MYAVDLHGMLLIPMSPRRIYGPGGEGENDALVHKRKDTAFKRFLQECDGGNPRKRVKPNAAPATGDEQPDASTSG